MVEPSMLDLVRSAYELFNNQDITSLLDFLDPEVEWPDVINEGVLRGPDAVAAYWAGQFAVATPTVILGELIDLGDTVIAVAYQQVYDLQGVPLGPGMAVVHRFTFRNGRIAKMEVTALDAIPDDVRARFQID